MLKAPIPENEAERLASLQKMQLLATPDEEVFDRVVRTAQRLFGVPVALVSLIDAHRQWFKACIGLPVRETGRDVSFCGHAILGDELFVIEDSREDKRFADNPLVTGDPKVIFYAGRPLKNSDGYAIGTLCLIDHRPRHFDARDRQSLNDLGAWVEQVLLCRELDLAQQEILLELGEIRRTQMLDPELNIWGAGAIQELLEQEILRAFAQRSWLAVMAIEIENFKEIPERIRPLLLNEVCKQLRTLLHSYDSLGRLTPNTLLLLLPAQLPARLEKLRERLHSMLELPILIADQVFDLRCRIGHAAADFVNETPESAVLLTACAESLSARDIR